MNNKENYKKFISEDEEVRSGFKVTSNRKKVWNIELGLLEELKKICEKHNLKYYADGGTLIGAVRHQGFIPRDDDIDIVMFRDDYEKFLKIAEEELPNYIKLFRYHQGYYKLVNINTTALSYENRWDKDFVGGIRIDIFPLDYASRFMVINRIKSRIMFFLRAIMLSQKCYGFIDTMKKWKQFFVRTLNFIFGRINYLKLRNLHERITKNTIFKGKKIYTAAAPCYFLPSNIYDKSHNVKFENTTICIADGYDVFLRTLYGDYMTPIIYEGGHDCRYSVDESYKDIIKNFNRHKSNKENYSNCKLLFTL